MSGHAPGRTYYSLPAPLEPGGFLVAVLGLRRVFESESSESADEFVARVTGQAIEEAIAAQTWTAFNVPARVVRFTEDESPEMPVEVALAGHLEAFLDFARRGDRSGFVDLAGMLGVDPKLHEEMWVGTQARVARAETKKPR